MNLGARLGARQAAVAEYIGFGYSIKETASELGISFDTVRTTMRAIYQKLGIQKATELSKYVYCRRFGLPLALCEPTRRLVAAGLLSVFLVGLFQHVDFTSRRTRRTVRTERVAGRRYV